MLFRSKTKTRKKRWQSTLVLPTKSIELRKIVLEERSFVKGNEGHDGEGRAEATFLQKRGAAEEGRAPVVVSDARCFSSSFDARRVAGSEESR